MAAAEKIKAVPRPIYNPAKKTLCRAGISMGTRALKTMAAPDTWVKRIIRF